MNHQILDLMRCYSPMNQGTGLDDGRTAEPGIIPHWYTYDEVTPRTLRIDWGKAKIKPKNKPENTPENTPEKEVKTSGKKVYKRVEKKESGGSRQAVKISVDGVEFASMGTYARIVNVTAWTVARWVKLGKTPDGKTINRV